MAAKDYKPDPIWHPEMSAAGSKAALTATQEGGSVGIWKPEASQAEYSAAGQAMRAKGLGPKPGLGLTSDGEKKALMAATGAMSTSRQRSDSTPTTAPSYPDSTNSAANALKAATSVHKHASNVNKPNTDTLKSPTSPPLDAARIHNAALTNLSREMYTSHPPVAPEVEEAKRQAGLRAAAVSMAKQMYMVQQKAIADAQEGEIGDSQHAANSVHRRKPSMGSSEDSLPPTQQYSNLQEAAQRLATERLAKLHDEHTAYRNYYGATVPGSKRLSIRGRTRRRDSSDGQDGDSDDERRRKIHSEMSLFTDKLAQVDAKKRQQDRDSLMEAARRNVRASMLGMDEKVLADTGKVTPAMMEDWETKANARAEADSKSRMVNHGKVSIGGGKFMNQSAIDVIAAAKVQPTLDEITEKAEKQRARDEQLREEAEERKRIAAEKEKDTKERNLRTKEDWERYNGKSLMLHREA